MSAGALRASALAAGLLLSLPAGPATASPAGDAAMREARALIPVPSGDPATAAAGTCAAAPVAPLAPIRVELRPTQSAPGAAGHMVMVAPDTPYGVAVSADGRQRYEVTVQARTLPRRPGSVYVAWASTPELDRVRRLGPLDGDLAAAGTVEWNKFLVFVTAEPSPDGERWTGPVFLTGMSPSGLLHTMRGHGIFEAHGVGC